MNYLNQTLNYLNETNSNKLIIIDGNSSENIQGWKTYNAPKPYGMWRTENKWTTWKAFELALESNEDLLFFEDDLISCKNALKYSEQLIVPDDCALVQFYSPWGNGLPNGIWRYHSKNFTFCQALKIPVRTLKLLVENKKTMEYLRTGGSDDCMAKICGDKNLLVGIHFPNLFQHVGLNSTVSECIVENRTSKSFPGENYDVLDLLKWYPKSYI